MTDLYLFKYFYDKLPVKKLKLIFLPQKIWDVFSTTASRTFKRKTVMQIGIIGLRKMGFNLALNLQRNGYEVAAQNINTDFVAKSKSGRNHHCTFGKRIVSKIEWPKSHLVPFTMNLAPIQ